MKLDKAAHTGSLKISEDVIMTITKQVTSEIEGVHSLASGRINLKDLIVRSDAEGSIKISMDADSTEISICIFLTYGFKIKEVAQKIQENVKSTVQNMTGVTVSKVNVFIVDVVKAANE